MKKKLQLDIFFSLIPFLVLNDSRPFELCIQGNNNVINKYLFDFKKERCPTKEEKHPPATEQLITT